MRAVRALPLVLLLNKRDVFARQLASTPLAVCAALADYAGPALDADADAAAEHVAAKFEALLTPGNGVGSSGPRVAGRQV